MGERVHDLTPADLDDLPAPCRACVFWETAHGPRGPDEEAPQAARDGKEAWWQAAQLEWGSPAKGVRAHDRLVGYALYGPAEQFPRARRLGRPPSEDALLLAALWVEPDARGQHLATALLQGVLRECHRAGRRAVEAFGMRNLPADVAANCVLPAEFLLARGFVIWRDHRRFPLFRLDLRQTARWQESVGEAVAGVLSALRRRGEPAHVPSRPALETAPGQPRG